MKYFIDTEFLEGTQKKWWGGKTKPTIDLISIGIVCEDGREFYAISKDFNLKEAWDRYQLDYGNGDQRNLPPKKVYWLRENVLKPIFDELKAKSAHDVKFVEDHFFTAGSGFDCGHLKVLIKRYGKTNEEIAREIIEFVYADVFKNFKNDRIEFHARTKEYGWEVNNKPQFYGYYADYDWVVFCWLFGKMIDLPKGFPMYCRDLKQTLVENGNPDISHLKSKDEHNALADARFNKRLYDYLQKL